MKITERQAAESDRKRKNQPVELDDYDTRTLRPKGEPVAIIGHAKGGYAGANIRLTAAMAEQMAVGALACGDAAAVLISATRGQSRARLFDNGKEKRT